MAGEITPEPLHGGAYGSPSDLAEVYRVAVARMSVDARAAAHGEEAALDRAAKWASVAIAADRRGRG